MNARLLLALVLLLATTAVHAQEAEPAWLEVADVALRLRSGPSIDDEVITRLTPREAVELLQRGEQWSRVRRQDGQAGWAHNDYLLPWDARNRVDARRRVGEQRLFSFPTELPGPGETWNFIERHAELRAVSDHSYIYAVKNRAQHHLPTDGALLELGSVFDENESIGRPSISGALRIRPPPPGDERIVILLTSGYDREGFLGGWYSPATGLIGLNIYQPGVCGQGRLYRRIFVPHPGARVRSPAP